jgi:hypothetical protein
MGLKKADQHSYWILLPITVVMILTGLLRHYATVLLQTTPKKQTLAKIREQRSLLRGINLRTNAHVISPAAFQTRKNHLVAAYKEGSFLADPEGRGKPPPNPMTDPAAMEGMMGMMKGNMAMMVPQTLIMGWINAFFSGFVISTLDPHSLPTQLRTYLPRKAFLLLCMLRETPTYNLYLTDRHVVL